MITQRNIVNARVPDNTHQDYSYYYYYWLTPGRIVGIAVGAVLLLLIIISLLTLACRRRSKAKNTNAAPSNFSGQSQPYRQAQQPVPTSYSPNWYYPVQGTVPFDQGKTVNTPSGQAPRPAPFGEVQRFPTTDQASGPLASDQVLRSPPASQAPATVPPGQVQTTAPPGQTQRHAPPSQAQKHGSPPPRHAHTQDTSAGNGGSSPPPYYPPTPSTPPLAHIVR